MVWTICGVNPLWPALGGWGHPGLAPGRGPEHAGRENAAAPVCPRGAGAHEEGHQVVLSTRALLTTYPEGWARLLFPIPGGGEGGCLVLWGASRHTLWGGFWVPMPVDQ